MRETPVISENYRALNRSLHESNQRYGSSGARWADTVAELARSHDLQEILDYGCGKQTLARALPGLRVRGYDPAFIELSSTPEPADLVICSDVLEHIEPECIDAVLDDLSRVTRKLGFFVIATRPAVKTLPDGRNAHLSLMSASRWLENLLTRFDIAYAIDHRPETQMRGWRARLGRKILAGQLAAALPQSGEMIVLVTPRANSK